MRRRVMARLYTKCSTCDDLMWFEERDVPPQAVRCKCGDTLLTEDGPSGAFVDVTLRDLDVIAVEEAKYS